MRLLFLDFDGVLHPCTAGTFIYLDRLENFLRKHPRVRVVLSTTWRADHPLPSLIKLFAPDLQGRLIGATPVLDDALPAARELEIRAWLRDQGCEQVPWAALDDDASLFSPGCPQLVCCETIRGLRPAQLAQVEAMLQLA